MAFAFVVIVAIMLVTNSKRVKNEVVIEQITPSIPF